MRTLLAILSIAGALGCAAPNRSGHDSAHAATASAQNRDPHGPPDVAGYIARLENSERVAYLDVDLVLEKLALRAGDVVCDLGCGPGVFALRFARAVPDGFVFAVDLEPRQLDRLREHLLALDLDNVVPVLASAETPHLPDRSCDVIFIGDTYHHFGDRVGYVRALRSALKPDGRLVILEYKPGDLPVGPPASHKLEPGVLERELAQAGYEQVSDFDSHRYHDFQVWRVRR